MKSGEYIAFGKPDYTDEEIEAVSRVMRSGWIGMGKEVEQFEAELAANTGAKQVVTTNSCTSALFLSLLVNDVKAGDEVIVPSLTWCSTANAVLYCGAKPVFCDVNENTLCAGTEEILDKLTPKTKAVIIVHYGGFAADVQQLRQALPPQVSIIEDAAHAFGAMYSNNVKVGNSGNLTCFSFYANKNISTGEGGAVALNNEAAAIRLKKLRQQGLLQSAWNRFTNPGATLYQEVETLGYNFNYIDLHACIGRVQLKRFNEMQQRRSETAQYFTNELNHLKANVRLQEKINHPQHAKHLYAVRLAVNEINITRNELVENLRKKNVGAGVHYMPLHLMDFYKKSCGALSLPVSEKIFNEILSLPLSASMQTEEVVKVIEVFRSVIEK